MKIISIQKIFRIIDSCINFAQLESCSNIVELYIRKIAKQGVVNYDLAKKHLFIRIKEKREELIIIEKFNNGKSY